MVSNVLLVSFSQRLQKPFERIVIDDSLLQIVDEICHAGGAVRRGLLNNIKRENKSQDTRGALINAMILLTTDSVHAAANYKGEQRQLYALYLVFLIPTYVSPESYTITVHRCTRRVNMYRPIQIHLTC
jgi:hypothetical protein